MTQARAQVGRHGLVDAPRLGQLQSLHDRDELRLALARHAGVAFLFLTDRGMRAALVVVAGPDGGGIGQGKQHLGQAAVQLARAAGLEVGATATIDEQGVAGEDVVAPDITHAARGVTRGVQGLQGLPAKRQRVAVLQLHARGADAAALRRGRAGTGQFGQLAGAGDVVGVGVGFHGPDQLQAVLAQNGQVALDLLVHRVDDERVARDLVKQHIGVGAGSGVKQLDRFHGNLLGF